MTDLLTDLNPRDPARIEPMLARLRALWLVHPDWRLGQLVVNTAGVGDPFYIEDEEMLAGLEKLAGEMPND